MSIGDNQASLERPDVKYTPNAMDLGLSVYWATCNVDATTPEGWGDYFAWGETETYYKAGHAYDNPCTYWKDGKSSGYSWDTYSFTSDSGSTFTKYNDTDGKYVLEAKDDVASAKWGAAWRMPTMTELSELCYRCRWEWTTKNGMSGYNVVSWEVGSDAAIFLPAAGVLDGGDLNEAFYYGYYLSSSLHDTHNAWYLNINENNVSASGAYPRFGGFSVRPVAE